MEILLKKNEGLVAKFLKSYITSDIEPEDITVVNYSPNREFTKQGFDTKVAV